MTATYEFLNDEQVNAFMDHGWLRVPKAFSRATAAEWTANIWTRLGMDPNDKETWTKEWVNMPSHRTELVETFSPAAWRAIGELLGGHDRISQEPRCQSRTDAFIVNLGRPEFDEHKAVRISAKDIVSFDKQALKNDNVGWHCDGDWFRHFLDSPEQALLVVPLFSDIRPGGGGTYIAPESAAKIARALADHPEGILPKGFEFGRLRDECEEFLELTGEVGDVILLHPFMMHAASPNLRRAVRIITNPSISLASPFVFKRPNPADYSLVELKTLKCLGVDPNVGLDWKPTGHRELVVPDRVQRQAAEKLKELERLKRSESQTKLA